MTPYQKGAQIKKLGYSIDYNPYRHKGSTEDYEQFVLGYNSTENTK